MSSRKIQDADVKGSADVTADSRLINDTKIYISSLSKRFDQAVADGDFAGSGGGINYIENFDAETDASGHVAYADAASATPVDGTGGSPNITITRSTSSPLRGAGSFLITKDAANRQGQGVSVDFTIDSADKNKTLAISFDYEASSGYTGLSGTEYMVAYVYDVTNAVLIPTSNVYIPHGSGTQKITFNSSTSTSYRLIFHIATTGTVAWTYKYDNLSVGPQQVISGFPAGPSTSYTPSFTGVGTPTGVDFRYWRLGEMMRIKGTFKCGTTTLTPASFTLPTGHSYPTSYSDANYIHVFGTWISSNSTRSHYYSNDGESGILTNDTNVTQTKLIFCHKGTQSGPDPDNISNFWTSGDYVSVDVIVPIAQWANTANFSNSLVEYASNSGMGAGDDSTSFVNDPNGSPWPSTAYSAEVNKKRVRFKNAILESDTIQIQYKAPSAGAWVDWKGHGVQPGAGTPGYDIMHFENNTGYGWGRTDVINSTDVDVIFGHYSSNGTTFGGAGNAWDATSGTYRWRVVKYSNAVPVASEPKASAEYSFITAAGYGATNTAIPYYTTASVASDPKNLLSVSNSSTLGLSVTALKKCTVWMAFPMGYTGTAEYKGITKNSTQLSTTIDSVTNSFVRFKTFSASSVVAEVMAKVPMEVGDVLRPHLATGLTLNGYMIYISAEEL